MAFLLLQYGDPYSGWETSGFPALPYWVPYWQSASPHQRKESILQWVVPEHFRSVTWGTNRLQAPAAPNINKTTETSFGAGRPLRDPVPGARVAVPGSATSEGVLHFQAFFLPIWPVVSLVRSLCL